MEPSGAELEIIVRDLTISYNDVGDKKNQTIIFIHGFPFDKNMWNMQLTALSPYVRCVAFDLAGYGRTSHREAYSIETFADDLDAFMHLMQIEKAAVCGLSMGGYISLRAMAKYPERFSKLILCDTQCIADSDEGRQKRFKAIEQIESEGLENYAAGFVKNVFTESSLQTKKEIVAEIQDTMLHTSPKSVTGTLKALAEREETCFVLPSIKIPTLIICGREDKITPPAQSEFMHNKINGSQLKILENAAHMSNLEQPAEFNKTLLSFLQA